MQLQDNINTEGMLTVSSVYEGDTCVCFNTSTQNVLVNL